MSPVENPHTVLACSITNEAATQNVRRPEEVGGVRHADTAFRDCCQWGARLSGFDLRPLSVG